MRITFKILLLVFIFSSINAFAGNKTDFSKSEEKRYFRKTMKLIYKGQHKHAKANLLELLEIDSANIDYNYELALLYYYDLNETDKALPYFEAVNRLKKEDQFLEIHYYLGQAYHFVGEYDKAINAYADFDQYIPENDKALKSEIEKSIAECKNAKELSKVNTTRIRNLGNRINTSFPEYVPVPINEDTILLFTSKRPYIMSENFGFEGTDRYEKVYISLKTGNKYSFAEKSSNTEAFQLLDQSKKWHNAIVSSTHDGNTLMIYKKNRLWTSHKQEGIWQEPIKVSKIVNFSFYQPHATITTDGKNIYFSSWSKKRGFGELDIYTSTKHENGNWGPAVNLGTAINTPYNDDSPEISADGKTLYFSSKGHKGAGGYDIYKSDLVDGKWTEPENLGFPINSPGDDIFFKFNSKGDLAYFSSYRKDGFGDMDIYAAIFGPQFDDCKQAEGNPVADMYIGFDIEDSVLIGDEFNIKGSVSHAKNMTISKYFWKLDNKIFVDSIDFNYKFDCIGDYNIKMEVEAIDNETKEATAFCVSKDVKVVADQLILADNNNTNNTDNNDNNNNNTDIIADNTNNNTDITNNDNTDIADVNNTNNTLKLNNIYFDFDRSNIRSSEIDVLNDNIEMLKQYKDAKIKVIAHTDSRGSAAYNKILSDKRAKSVYDYLIAHGIDKDRIIEVVGKGEEELVNNCKDQVSCSKQDHQLNRRTELEIIY